ncbi:MAG TPA: type II secretion system protein GspM [Lamprocystis sp. (in: g-proteobacteria)]|nr:type II secretion system protein GspM [Lamprocystis sp. (in: g-proteobacteria)]
MTQGAVNKRYCALVWLAAILLPVLLIATITIPWLEESQRLNEGIATGAEQLDRYRRLIETLPALRTELEQVNNNQAFRAFYFEAATAALAGAELQRKVQDIITAAKGRLISTQLLPAEKDEQPPRVRLRTQIQGSTETLLEVLRALDQARPFLFVEQVSIRSTARPELPEQPVRGRAVRRPTADEGGELTVRLDIFGFALGGRA